MNDDDYDEVFLTVVYLVLLVTSHANLINFVYL